MARQENGSQHNGDVDERGLVNNVRRKWAVQEDAVLASRLQDSEFAHKYNRNCAERRQARQDVPLARSVQTDEELQLQREQLRQLQQQQIIEEHDAVVAEQLHSEELFHREKERIHRELKDQELARKLQHKERQRYELRKKEKELRRQRKLLERELQRNAVSVLESETVVADNPGQESSLDRALNSQPIAATAAVVEGRVRSDGKLEDQGDFTDLYIKPSKDMPVGQKQQLQQLQDEELARLLQDQERRRGGSAVSRDQLKAIELRDAELAQLIHEEEKLKRRRERHSHHRQHHRQTSDIGPANVASGGGVADQYSSSLPPSLPENARQCTCEDQSPSLASGGSGSRVADDVSPSYHESTKYASRPLPATPRSPDAVRTTSVPYNMSLARALDHDYGRSQDVTSEPVECESSSSREQQQMMFEKTDLRAGTAESDTRISPTPGPSPQFSDNVFAAIDPTCSRDRGCVPKNISSRPTEPGLSGRQPILASDLNAARRRAPIVVEDHYCDLDDIQNSLGGLSIVPNQRRPAVSRDSQVSAERGGGNCKQQ